MHFYETMYILRPDISEGLADKTHEKLLGLVTENGGRVLKLQNWGKRKLAYEIKRNIKGIYFLLLYCAPAGVVRTLETQLKYNELVLRYQTVLNQRDADVEALAARYENEPDRVGFKQRYDEDEEYERFAKKSRGPDESFDSNSDEREDGSGEAAIGEGGFEGKDSE